MSASHALYSTQRVPAPGVWCVAVRCHSAGGPDRRPQFSCQRPVCARHAHQDHVTVFPQTTGLQKTPTQFLLVINLVLNLDHRMYSKQICKGLVKPQMLCSDATLNTLHIIKHYILYIQYSHLFTFCLHETFELTTVTPIIPVCARESCAKLTRLCQAIWAQTRFSTCVIRTVCVLQESSVVM